MNARALLLAGAVADALFAQVQHAITFCFHHALADGLALVACIAQPCGMHVEPIAVHLDDHGPDRQLKVREDAVPQVDVLEETLAELG